LARNASPFVAVSLKVGSLSSSNQVHGESSFSTGRPTISIEKVFPILALSVFTALIGMGIIIPLIPIYVERMGVTGIWIGVLFAVYSGTRVVMAPFVGRLSDRKGRKPLLIAGLILVVVASLGYIWANTIWQLVMVRIVHGAAGGMIFPIAMSYVGDLSPIGKEGKWMGYFSATVFMALGVGPLLGGVLTENFGMTVTFVTMSCLGFLSFLLTVVLLPDSRAKQAVDKARISFRAIASSGMVQGLFVYRMTLEAGWGAYIGFISILASVNLGLSASQIGILLTANILPSSVMMIIFGRIADKVSKKGMIVVSGLVTAASLAAMPLVGGFWSLLILNIFAGIVGAAEYPPASALVITEGRRFGMGSTVAVMTMSTGLGMAIGPLMGGFILDAVDVNASFYSAGGIMVLGIILLVGLSRRHRYSNDTEDSN
jgi:multidrug resistance protein